MKKIIFAVFAVVLFSCTVAFAADETTTATIKAISVSGDSATATVLDKSGKERKIQIKDQSTLDKIKSKQLKADDEVRIKFDPATGVAKTFRKTAGC